MKLRTLIATSFLALPLCQAAEPGFTDLFNGKDLTGWKRVNGTGEYKVEGDQIVGKGENVKANTFLRTEKTYKDFDFRFEMKLAKKAGNSGMMFRGLQKPGADGRVFGYQCEHDDNEERAWTAGLYDEARRAWLVPYRNDDKKKTFPEAEVKKQEDDRKAFTKQGQEITKWDDWNDVRIVCKGKHIQIWLNGKERVDYTDDAPDFTPEGFFALQVHAGKSCDVRWRNIRIKEL
ncbi:3-keto-disaccharide hydrolase [Luteolibacter soli]|uniref:DUF1080 domain-containing protein n=1 Tax=Luteolibacter soli TaxID=3135280 RepID=A0ABU9APZ2_9BACT